MSCVASPELHSHPRRGACRHEAAKSEKLPGRSGEHRQLEPGVLMIAAQNTTPFARSGSAFADARSSTPLCFESEIRGCVRSLAVFGAGTGGCGKHGRLLFVQGFAQGVPKPTPSF